MHCDQAESYPAAYSEAHRIRVLAMPCSAAEQRVVVDGNLTTSRGPGTALEFALALVEQLYGSEKAKEVAGPMVVHDSVGSFMHA